MNIYKISLTPRGSINAFPDSQTLFGSICWSIRDLYGEAELEKLLDDFPNRDERFVVSSTFLEDLFKAPMMIWATLEEIINIGEKAGMESSQVSKRGKELKKIEYLSKVVFKTYLRGELDRLQVVEAILSEEGEYVLKNGILHYRDEDIPEYNIYIESSRRNYINRLSSTTYEGQLFYYNRVFLPENASLYFLLKTNNIEYFLPIFRYMSDIGIGGDKSIGINSYEVSYDGEFTYEKNIKENILLSKYIPYYEEVDWINSFFKISVGNYMMESRDEFFGENISKDEVGFLLEGSTLILNQEKDIYGRLPIVKEIRGKKIRQNGLGFFL